MVEKKNPRRRRALVAALWIGILAVGWYAADAWIARFEPWLAVRLTREVGRPVRLAGLGYRPLWGAKIDRVEVEGLGRAEGVSIDLAVGRLFDGELFLERASIDSASVRVAREPAGRWNFEGLFPDADSSAPAAFARIDLARISIEIETAAAYLGSLSVTPESGGVHRFAWSGRVRAGEVAAAGSGLASAGPRGGTGSFDIAVTAPHEIRAKAEATWDTALRARGPVSFAVFSEGIRVAGAGEYDVRAEAGATGPYLRAGEIRLARLEVGGAETFAFPFSSRDLRISLDADRLPFAPDAVLPFRAEGVFRSPLLAAEARIGLRASYDPSAERLDLAALTLAAPNLRIAGRGSASRATQRLDLRADGVGVPEALEFFRSLRGFDPLAGVAADGEIRGDFSLSSSGGRATASGDWTIAAGSFRTPQASLTYRDARYRLGYDPARGAEIEMRAAIAASILREGEEIPIVRAGTIAARATFAPSGRIEIESLDLRDAIGRFTLRAAIDTEADARIRAEEVDLKAVHSLARHWTTLSPGMGAHGEISGEVRVRAPRDPARFFDSARVEGEARLARATLGLSENPKIRLDGVSGTFAIDWRPRATGESVSVSSRTERPRNLHVERIQAGDIVLTDFTSSVDVAGRELRIENGVFDLAGGRGEIAGVISARAGRAVQTALLGRVRALRLQEIYDRLQPFEGELTGTADARFQFAMEGSRLANLHAEVRADRGGRIGARLLRELAEKMDPGSTKIALLGLSQFEYKKFFVDLDLFRDYYDRETARNKFEPPLSETIRDEVLMTVGFDGPLPIWGPIHIDVNLEVRGMQLQLLLESARRNRARAAPPPATSGPPPPRASSAAETLPASGGDSRSVPVPPR